MKLLKRLFCIHRYEYDVNWNAELIKECLKCGKVKKLGDV